MIPLDVVSLNLDYAGSTDNVVISFYASLTQDSTYTGNEVPFFSYTAEGIVATEDDLTFIVKDVPHFRIGLDVTGATDAHTCDAIYYDAWNWDST